MPKALETPGAETATPQTPKLAPKKPTPPAAERKVVYDKPHAEVYIGDTALDADAAKNLLGWKEVEKDGIPEIAGELNLQVILENNSKNRPLTGAWLKTLRQEHLRKRWKFNGEALSIGRTGLVLSGQHRLISLVLAEALRATDPDAYGADPLKLETTITYGVDESDETFRSLNCGKVGTLVEVLYRSDLFGKSVSSGDRKKMASLTDWAIRLLWERTGASSDAYGLKRTHAEAIDFLERHNRILRAVKHIHGEDKDGAITQYITPGTASGLLYLMAASSSVTDKYKEKRDETGIKWDNWDKACEFWALLASGDKRFHALHEVMMNLQNDVTLSGGSAAERKALLITAWNEYSEKNHIHNKGANKPDEWLTYVINNEVKSLAETPDCGGIDIGMLEEPEPEPDPTVEEVEKAKGKTKKPKTLGQIIDDMLTKNKSTVILMKGEKNYKVWGNDLDKVAKVLSLKKQTDKEIEREFVNFPVAQLAAMVDLLHLAEMKVATAEPDKDGNPVVTDIKMTAQVKETLEKRKAGDGKPTPKPKPKKGLKGGTE